MTKLLKSGLSHDVDSGSDIALCIKFDKQLVI